MCVYAPLRARAGVGYVYLVAGVLANVRGQMVQKRVEHGRVVGHHLLCLEAVLVCKCVHMHVRAWFGV